MEPGLLHSLHRAHPGRPIGIEDDGVILELNKERGVTDPSDSCLSLLGRGVVGV